MADEVQASKALDIASRALLIMWIALLVPWLWLAPISFMAFDSGDDLSARFFVLSVCTYPITVVIAALLRKSTPWVLLLPCLNIIGALASAK